eukprot:540285-Prorocentrum_minimum.AAC.5
MSIQFSKSSRQTCGSSSLQQKGEARSLEDLTVILLATLLLRGRALWGEPFERPQAIRERKVRHNGVLASKHPSRLRNNVKG